MTKILNGKYSSYSSFIFNRALKLYPIYWIVLLLSYFFHHLDINSLNQWWKHYYIFTNLLIVGSNFTAIIQAEDGYLSFLQIGQQLTADSISWEKYIYVGPAWSVAVEISFYLLAPFLLKAKYFYPKILVMICISFASFLYLIFKDSWFVPWSYNFLPPNLYLFAMGAISWKLYVSNFFQTVYSKTAGAAVFLTVINFIIFYEYTHKPVEIGLYRIDLITDLIGLIVFAISIPFIFKLSKSSSMDRLLGDLSYPIYISHFFVIFYNPYFKGVNLILLTLLFSIVIKSTVGNLLNSIREKLVR